MTRTIADLGGGEAAAARRCAGARGSWGANGDEQLDAMVPALRDLSRSAAAAFAVTELVGRSRCVIAARRAAVRLMREQVTPAELAGALSLNARAVRRLLAEPPPPSPHLSAVRLQMQLRAHRR